MKARHVLTRPHPVLVAAIYLALFVHALARGHGVIGFGLGLFVWTFLEYATHRWVLHGFTGRTYDFLHGGHHRHPHDVRRAHVPLTHSLAIAALLHAAAFAVFDAWSWLAGLLFGYVTFEVMHALLHSRWRRFVGRRLKTHHARHHHVDERGGFGVSTRFWDRVFGTMPDKPHPFVACNDDDDVTEAL